MWELVSVCCGCVAINLSFGLWTWHGRFISRDHPLPLRSSDLGPSLPDTKMPKWSTGEGVPTIGQKEKKRNI